MGTLRTDHYYVVLGWMKTELGLKGLDLALYAIVYGFSQTTEQGYTGSLRYLAEWTDSTRQTVRLRLKSLVDKGLLIKKDVYQNGVKYCEYRAYGNHGMNDTATGCDCHSHGV